MVFLFVCSCGMLPLTICRRWVLHLECEIFVVLVFACYLCVLFVRIALVLIFIVKRTCSFAMYLCVRSLLLIVYLSHFCSIALLLRFVF